jgi:hypothetical protein
MVYEIIAASSTRFPCFNSRCRNDEKTTSIASYPNSPPNENPVHSKAHCRHLSLNHDNKPPRYNSQDRNLDLPPRQPGPAAYQLTRTSHRNTGHQQHHAQQKHRATKAASDAKARAPPPMKYAADYRHWIRFAENEKTKSLHHIAATSQLCPFFVHNTLFFRGQ